MAIDADLIQKCADPFLKPAIIEQFIKGAGSPDPLAIVVRSGERVILVPPVKTPEEALAVARSHVGRAVVRVGVTQHPAGVGIKDPSELSTDLFDTCKNLRTGTALFGKVWRIVWKWYGSPKNDSVLSEVLDDALDAWKRGQFEEISVFTAPDPGGVPPTAQKREETARPSEVAPAAAPKETVSGDPNKSSIRIDLSGIGGRSP